jgi:hypothetical protein
MPRDLERDELKLLKTCLDELAHEESASIDDIEKIFDAQIRYRFGELIGRAASNFGGTGLF